MLVALAVRALSFFIKYFHVVAMAEVVPKMNNAYCYRMLVSDLRLEPPVANVEDSTDSKKFLIHKIWLCR